MAVHEIQRKTPPPFLDFFLLGSLFSFLLLSPWFYGLVRFRDQLITEVLVFTLFLISVPFLNRENILRPKKNGIDFWICSSLVLGLFYVLCSVLPYRSFLAFLRLFSCALFYGLIRSVARTEARVRLFLWIILISGFFYAVYGLAQYYGFFPHPFWYQPNSLASRYVNGGHFAAFLLFPLFIGAALAFSSRNWIVQGILFSLLLILLWTLLLTRARTVWIVFLVGAVIFVWLAHRGRLLDNRAMLGILLLAVGGGVLLLKGGGLEEIVSRFKGLGETVAASLDPKEIKEVRFYTLLYRWRLWQGAFSAISDRPWGWGLGTFSAIFPQYRVHGDRFVIDYAHNEFLQVGVDLGILGVLLLIGFSLFYLKWAALFLKSRQASPFEKAVAISFTTIWIGLVLTSQVDFPLRIQATSLFFAAFLALSAYLFEVPESVSQAAPFKGKPRRFVFQFVSFLTVLFVSVLTSRQLFAQIHFERGQELEKNLAWQKALGEYKKATRLAPLYAEYHATLAQLSQSRASISLNRDQRKQLRVEAVRSYQEAIRLQPRESIYHYGLALLYEEEGELKPAQSEFRKAISNDPTHFIYVSEYGYFAVRHSWTDEAISAFEKLKDFPDREVPLGDILGKCAGLTQDYEKLKRVVPNTPQGHHTFGLILADKGKLEAAKKEFQLAIEQRITNPAYNRDELRSVLISIGDTYASHDRIQDALETYERVVAMNPQDQEAQRKLQNLSKRLRVLESTPPLLPS